MFPTWHPRGDWLAPAPPIKGLRINWAKIDTVVIHYTADDDLIDGDPGEHAEQLDDYLRAIQISYEKVRGYSIGYNVPVDWLGGQWEARGFDIKCAANLDHNDHTFTILVLVDGADRCTDLAAASIRNLIGRAEGCAGRELFIRGHDELRDPHHPTGCPGSGLLAQIHEGIFSPRWTPPSPPVPPQIPTPEDDEMNLILYRDRRFNNVFRVGDSAVTVGGAIVAHDKANKIDEVLDVHDESLISYMRASGLRAGQMRPNGEPGMPEAAAAFLAALPADLA